MSTQLFTQADIAQLPSRYRAHFINSLSGFKSANLLATVNADGQTNLAMISSLVHLGADPALMGYITRPQTVTRHSVENIVATGVYTFNQVNSSMLPAAHQCGAKYPREVSEFAATGLNEGYVDNFAAPYVQQSNLSIGLRLVEKALIKHNGTELIIGEIAWVRLPSAVVADDGYVALELLDTVAVSGLDGYHRTQRIARFSYPEAEQPVQQLKSLE